MDDNLPQATYSEWEERIAQCENMYDLTVTAKDAFKSLLTLKERKKLKSEIRDQMTRISNGQYLERELGGAELCDHEASIWANATPDAPYSRFFLDWQQNPTEDGSNWYTDDPTFQVSLKIAEDSLAQWISNGGKDSKEKLSFVKPFTAHDHRALSTDWAKSKEYRVKAAENLLKILKAYRSKNQEVLNKNFALLAMVATKDHWSRDLLKRLKNGGKVSLAQYLKLFSQRLAALRKTEVMSFHDWHRIARTVTRVYKLLGFNARPVSSETIPQDPTQDALNYSSPLEEDLSLDESYLQEFTPELEEQVPVEYSEELDLS